MRDFSDTDAEAVARMRIILSREDPQKDECLEWRGSRDRQNYGRLWVGGRSGRNYPAHRLAMCATEGYDYVEIEGWLVRHQCHNPPCFNPHHLLVGNDKQNVLDRVFADRTHRSMGESNPKAKLSDEDVEEIRDWHDQGWKHTEIAEMYNVSAVQIGRIVNRKQRN